MSVRQRQRNERERERERERKGEEEEEVQIKIWNLNVVKNIKFISYTIKFSSHKSNLTAR